MSRDDSQAGSLAARNRVSPTKFNVKLAGS